MNLLSPKIRQAAHPSESWKYFLELAYPTNQGSSSVDINRMAAWTAYEEIFMYELNPPAVFAHESVVADPRYKERLDNVVAALMEPVDPVIYKDEDIPDLINKHNIFKRRVSMGTLEEISDPILLFNTFRFDGRRGEMQEQLKQQGVKSPNAALLGYGPFSWANYCLPGDPHRNDKVCRPCWRIHSQSGCVHRCHYCGLGGLLIRRKR